MSLGFVFYEIISGKSSRRKSHSQSLFSNNDNESKEDEGQNDESKLHISHAEVYSALVGKIPIPFMRIIMALIEANITTKRYQAASE
eukprot:15083260-Ditylum_brightwellii.AAC.1